MLVFVDTGRFLAQQGGSRLEGAQGRARNAPRLGGAGTTGKEARGRTDERDERSHFGQRQRGAPRENPSQGTSGAPHEQPQGQEGKKEGRNSLAPVVHLGVAPLTE